MLDRLLTLLPAKHPIADTEMYYTSDGTTPRKAGIIKAYMVIEQGENIAWSHATQNSSPYSVITLQNNRPERLMHMAKENFNEIEKKAAALLQEYSIDALDGVDIITLAQKMGFVVGNAKLDDNEDGFIAVDEQETEMFGVSSNKVRRIHSKIYYSKKKRGFGIRAD